MHTLAYTHLSHFIYIEKECLTAILQLNGSFNTVILLFFSETEILGEKKLILPKNRGWT